MSDDLAATIRAAFADTSVDFASVGRNQSGDFFASVKRSGRGYGIHHARDPVEAILKALTAPREPTLRDEAMEAAKAAALSRPTEPPADDDLFG